MKTVFLYGPNEWGITKAIVHKAETFVNNCMCKILSVNWPEKTTKEDLWGKQSGNR